VLEERAALLDRIDSAVDRLSEATARGDKARQARLRVERAAAERALRALAGRARERVPALAGMLFPAVSPIGTLRSALGPDSVAICYTWTGDGAVALVVRDSGPVVARKLPVRPDQVRAALFDADARRASSYRPDLAPGLRALWDALIVPVADLLAGKRHLLVCPDGPLYFVPWPALAGAEGHDLADGIAVSVLPSLDTLVLLRTEAAERAARRTGERVPLAAFGDPAYPDAAGGGDAGEDRSAGRQSLSEAVAEGLLRPLRIPFTGEEATRVAASVAGAGSALTGGDASEAEFRALAPHARYLHVACHGYYNDRDPLESGVVLSLVGARPGGAATDGVISARELLSMSLDADLVVLSACKTAAGREIGGEGVVGLTRAAMLAGTPSVVSTLWAVDDVSTKELMVRFYADLALGLDKSEALRHAQVSVRDDPSHPEWRDPRVWAAFQLWGAP
jgi:CHAT domain-containing protein